MKKVIASAGLLALGAVGVYSARADWAAGADKPWTISGTLRGFYDDNYNTQPNNTPGKQHTFGFEVSPRAAISWSDGPTSLSSSYTYSEKYYERRPGNKSDQSHDFELAFNHAFNERYKMDLEESFVDSQEPEVLSGGGPVTFPLRANGDNFRNTAAVNFNATVTRLLGIVVGYANTFYDYTAQPAPGTVSYGTALNRFEHQLTLNSRWTIDPETVGIFGYQFNYVDYTGHGSLQLPVFPYESPKTRNNYTHNIYVGVEHSFTSQLSFSGRAGIQISDYYNSQNAPGGRAGADDVGPFADLSLSYNYMENGSLTVGFRQAKNQTDVGGNLNGSLTQDQESSTLYAAINQTLTPLSPNLTASLNAQYQNSV